MSHSLILLFGMPRSGTTWIGKIFDSHPDTLYRHEPDSSGSLNEIPLLADAGDAERHRRLAADFATRLPTMRQTKVTASLPIFPKRYYRGPLLPLRKLFVYGAKLASKALGEMPVPDVVDYSRVQDLKVVWKSIESVGRMGLLARAIAPAKSVLILRHPCGYAASVLRGEARRQFEGKGMSSEDWGMFELLLQLPQARSYGLTLEKLQAMSPVERLAWRWALFNEKAMADLEGVPGSAVVRYEDFCADPMGATRRAFQLCGLDWNGQTEAFLRASTSQEKDAYYSVFKDPMKSANKWREELSPEQIAEIMSVVRQTAPGKLYAEDAGGAPSGA